MGDHIEIEAELEGPSIALELAADLEKTVAKLGIVPFRQERYLEAFIVILKMPPERSPKIQLPHIHGEAHRAKSVGGGKARRIRGQRVEVSLAIRQRGFSEISSPGRKRGI